MLFILQYFCNTIRINKEISNLSQTARLKENTHSISIITGALVINHHLLFGKEFAF